MSTKWCRPQHGRLHIISGLTSDETALAIDAAGTVLDIENDDCLWKPRGAAWHQPGNGIFTGLVTAERAANWLCSFSATYLTVHRPAAIPLPARSRTHRVTDPNRTGRDSCPIAATVYVSRFGQPATRTQPALCVRDRDRRRGRLGNGRVQFLAQRNASEFADRADEYLRSDSRQDDRAT